MLRIIPATGNIFRIFPWEVSGNLTKNLHWQTTDIQNLAALFFVTLLCYSLESQSNCCKPATEFVRQSLQTIFRSWPMTFLKRLRVLKNIIKKDQPSHKLNSIFHSGFRSRRFATQVWLRTFFNVISRSGSR